MAIPWTKFISILIIFKALFWIKICLRTRNSCKKYKLANCGQSWSKSVYLRSLGLGIPIGQNCCVGIGRMRGGFINKLGRRCQNGGDIYMHIEYVLYMFTLDMKKMSTFM